MTGWHSFILHRHTYLFISLACALKRDGHQFVTHTIFDLSLHFSTIVLTLLTKQHLMGILWLHSATISFQRHFIIITWQRWRHPLFLKVRNLFFISIFYIYTIALDFFWIITLKKSLICMPKLLCIYFFSSIMKLYIIIIRYQ